MLPIRGLEPWKEAKVGVIYHHDRETKAPIAGTARYVAVVNGLGEFAPVLEDALRVERAEELHTVLWLGDGAVSDWRLAEQLLPDSIQILDWYHALQHAVDCGKVLLGEESPSLPLWLERSKQLLAAGEPSLFIDELMACLALLPRRRSNHDALEAIDGLVRSHRTNAHRMRYALYRESGFPTASGRERASSRAPGADEARRPALVHAQRPQGRRPARRAQDCWPARGLRRHPTGPRPLEHTGPLLAPRPLPLRTRRHSRATQVSRELLKLIVRPVPGAPPAPRTR